MARAKIDAKVCRERGKRRLAPLYAERCGASGTRPRNDEMLIRWPCPRSMKCATSTCIPYSADLTLSDIMSSMSSSVRSEHRSRDARPALLIQTSKPPNASMAASRSGSTSARFVTSVSTTMARGDPRCIASAATRSSSGRRRAASTSACHRPRVAPQASTNSGARASDDDRLVCHLYPALP
jgi:hypothetical protein